MRIWLYGEPFSGKTTFASQFPGAKVISTDGNAEGLFKKEDIIRVRNYKDLENALNELKKESPEWLVIDVIDYLYDICRTYVLDKNNVEDEGDIPYRGYKMVRQFFWGVITKISNLCDNIIFISHEDIQVEKNKFGREITKYVPKFEAKMLTQMTGIMTVVGRCLKETSEKNDSAYVLRIGHNDNEIGGTRFKLKETQIPQGYESFMNNIVKE